jgi:hypothetical protein
VKSQGIIFYGDNRNKVLKAAYDAAIEHISIGMNADDLARIERHVSVGTYPNFLHIKKENDENEISINKSREIGNFLSQKASLFSKRAVLIEDFEDMSRNAANSILKILEEPPLDVVLILTTIKLLSILPTVRSRCIKIRVKSEAFDTEKFLTPLDLACSLLENFDKNLIEKFLDFIESGCKNSTEFAKQNTEYFELFLKVALTFCSFRSKKECDLLYSEKVVDLQSFFTLSKGAYPDKQAAIIAVCEMLKP